MRQSVKFSRAAFLRTEELSSFSFDRYASQKSYRGTDFRPSCRTYSTILLNFMGIIVGCSIVSMKYSETNIRLFGVLPRLSSTRLLTGEMLIWNISLTTPLRRLGSRMSRPTTLHLRHSQTYVPDEERAISRCFSRSTFHFLAMLQTPRRAKA